MNKYAHGRTAALLARANGEQIDRFQETCDRIVVAKLELKEQELDETLAFYATWSAGWWQTLREIDKVRGQLIAARSRP